MCLIIIDFGVNMFKNSVGYILGHHAWFVINGFQSPLKTPEMARLL